MQATTDSVSRPDNQRRIAREAPSRSFVWPSYGGRYQAQFGAGEDERPGSIVQPSGVAMATRAAAMCVP